MHPLLTFIIPVRHPANSVDWIEQKNRLTDTIASISAQKNPLWQAVIVANNGSDLPELPPKFRVEWVDFLPNPIHDMRSAPLEQVYDQVRLDKGRRVLLGMLSGRSEYYMIVDDDDFISNKITSFVADNNGGPGWKIDRGYLWSSGGYIISKYDDFSNYCGTSLIIRSDIYNLPDRFVEAGETYIKDMLGSHVRITQILLQRGIALAPLPFRGAIYRIGHPGAHSRSSGLLAGMMRLSRLRRPRQWLRDIIALRPITPAIRREFFAATPKYKLKTAPIKASTIR